MLRTHLTKPMNSNWIYTSVATRKTMRTQRSCESCCMSNRTPSATSINFGLHSLRCSREVHRLERWRIFQERVAQTNKPQPFRNGWRQVEFTMVQLQNALQFPPRKKTTGRILEVSQGKGTNHLRMFSPLLVCTCLHQHFDTKTILKTSSLYNWVPHFNPASVTGSSRTLCESQILGPRKISQISQTSEVLILR